MGLTTEARRPRRRRDLTPDLQLVFAKRIQEHIDEADLICEGLWHEGPALISHLQNRGGFGAVSLRKLAYECGLSAGYLSKVNRHVEIISMGAYLRLCELLEAEKEETARA